MGVKMWESGGVFVAEGSEERSKHIWYGDGGIGEAVRTGQGKEVVEEVGASKNHNSKFKRKKRIQLDFFLVRVYCASIFAVKKKYE